MKLFELDPNNPIDRELSKTSGNIAKDGSLDPNDIAAQEEPMGGPENTPDAPMGAAGMGGMDDAPQTPTKPADSALMARVKGHDYLQKYDHAKLDAPTHPLVIMSMGMEDLGPLRNKIRVMVDQAELSATPSSSKNSKIDAARDMLSFVDIVAAYKKQAVKNDKTRNPTPVRQKPSSKIKRGQQIKPKK